MVSLITVADTADTAGAAVGGSAELSKSVGRDVKVSTRRRQPLHPIIAYAGQIQPAVWWHPSRMGDLAHGSSRTVPAAPLIGRTACTPPWVRSEVLGTERHAAVNQKTQHCARALKIGSNSSIGRFFARASDTAGKTVSGICNAVGRAHHHHVVRTKP